MAHHDLFVNNVSEGQVAEKLREQVVSLHVVLGLHFALEAIHFVQLLGFMVAPAHEEVLGEAHLPR